MTRVIAPRDYFNQKGVLLLAKGTETTEEILSRLGKLCGPSNAAPDTPENKEHPDHLPIALELGKKMQLPNLAAIEKPNKVLTEVIFASKKKPWWMFVSALSNYVDWLYAHSIDVAIISLMMAKELGFDEQQMLNIGIGSFLHDTGKLLVPKEIIQKPGPLNDTERASMRQHCALGMTALKEHYLPRECTDIILQHHERLDGSGYPNGLTGEEISQSAKIVMIADVVDAVTSGRPYRPLKGMRDAMQLLRSEPEKYEQEYVSVFGKIVGE
jgi:putative nucleotidyltransferase with HDIG domain